jgi:hypothetical protein
MRPAFAAGAHHHAVLAASLEIDVRGHPAGLADQS